MEDKLNVLAPEVVKVDELDKNNLENSVNVQEL